MCPTHGDTVAATRERHARERAALLTLANPGTPMVDFDEEALGVVPPSMAAKKLMQLLAQGPRDTMRNPTVHGSIAARSATTVVRRAWEEKFMHEASGSERPCVNATTKTCFAGIIPNNGVTDAALALVEFYAEEEYQEIRARGWKWPQPRRPCVLCQRQAVFSRFLACRANGTSAPPGVCYSRFGNLVEQRGEYCVEDVFVSQPGVYEGVVVPVVIPAVGDYSVTSVAGIRHVRQHLPLPESRRSRFFF